LKVGFNKDGLTLNGKKFDPLNFTFMGHGIESDGTVKQTDAFEILDALTSVRTSGEEETPKVDKIRALKSIIK